MASSGIQKLNLKGSIRLGDAGIAALVKECRNLIYLDISGKAMKLSCQLQPVEKEIDFI